MTQHSVPWDYQYPSVGADYAHEQNNQDICRGRFIAPTADLSALLPISISG
ncbi:MAG TPA: hypothetical protein VKP04_01635 [Ktedonobacteraceae bacterium]|nr:hypothetical protein [Ktedonobacteraceae bacterium]